MKKIGSLILCLFLLLQVVGCNTNTQTTTLPITSESHLEDDVTTELTTEQSTVMTSIETTPTTTTTTTEAAINTDWEINYYVDEFGDKTDDNYALGSFTGTFANSATYSSDLSVYVYYTEPFNESAFLFRLLEYDTYPVTYTSSDLFLLKLKIDNEVYEVQLSAFPPSGDLALFDATGDLDKTLQEYTDSRKDVIKALKAAMVEGKTVSCVILHSNDAIDLMIGESRSKYNFKMNGEGFSTIIKELN